VILFHYNVEYLNHDEEHMDITAPLVSTFAEHNRTSVGIFFVSCTSFALVSYIVYDMVVFHALRKWILSMHAAGSAVVDKLATMDRIVRVCIVVFPLLTASQILALWLFTFVHLAAILWFLLAFLGTCAGYLVMWTVMQRIKSVVKETSSELYMSVKLKQLNLLALYAILSVVTVAAAFLSATWLASVGWTLKMLLAVYPKAFVDLDQEWQGYKHLDEDDKLDFKAFLAGEGDNE
jgi:hypothetical protein